MSRCRASAAQPSVSEPSSTWSRLYSGQLQRGASYVDLQRCIGIWITDFSELSGARFHSTFRVLEVHDGEPLTEHLELHWVELPKLPGALERNGEPDLVAWGKFLAAVEDEELETLAMEHPVLKQAKRGPGPAERGPGSAAAR